MKITVKPNFLEMKLNLKERRQLKKMVKDMTPVEAEDIFFDNFLIGKTPYRPINPENVGCLTSAPLITDQTDVWGFMQYAVMDLTGLLINGTIVYWEKG